MKLMSDVGLMLSTNRQYIWNKPKSLPLDDYSVNVQGGLMVVSSCGQPKKRDIGIGRTRSPH